MNRSHQPEVRTERIAHRAAVERLRKVYQRLAEFEAQAMSPLDEENHVTNAKKEQEVHK